MEWFFVFYLKTTVGWMDIYTIDASFPDAKMACDEWNDSSPIQVCYAVMKV